MNGWPVWEPWVALDWSAAQEMYLPVVMPALGSEGHPAAVWVTRYAEPPLTVKKSSIPSEFASVPVAYIRSARADAATQNTARANNATRFITIAPR